MSDDTDDESTPKSNKKDPPDRSAAVTPVIKDQAIFEFLESLFYGDPEPEQFPERVELNIVSGRYSAKIEATIWVRPYAPIRATGEAVKRGAGAAKPSREQLVALSNLLLEKMRRDCDEAGHARGYAVHAWSSSKSDGPYMVHPKRMSPSGRYAKKSGDDDEEDGAPLTRDQKYVLQMMSQMKARDELQFEMITGLIDRYSRDKDRDSNEIDRLHRKLAEKNDQLERALSLELDREERRDAAKMRRQIAEKGWQAVETYGPMLVGSLMKKPVVDGTVEPSSEVEALRDFLKTKEEGGQMTLQQAHDAFGDWNAETGELNVPGVLQPEQSMVLVQVANGKLPLDKIDELMPGGPLEITMEQGIRLMNVFGPQLAPLQKIIAARMSKKEK